MPSIHAVRCPDSGLEAWIAVDSVSDGLAFGGTRFRVGLGPDEVVELARCMSWKLAGHGHPVGGAKAGFSCAPDDPRLPGLIRTFAGELGGLLSSTVILGKDLGASDALLDSIYEAAAVPQLEAVRKRHPSSECPARLRDLAGYRPYMTGLGIAYCLEEALGEDLSGLDVLIQGVGVVGVGAALRLAERGARIVGISDVEGGVVCAAGLDVGRLAAIREEGCGLNSLSLPVGAVRLPREELLRTPADLLVLAATSNSVDASMAETLGARSVVEGANFGLTQPARGVLHDRGVMVLPDIIANSASAAMACRQMAAGNTLSDRLLWQQIRSSIRQSTRMALEESKRGGRSLRDAWLGILAQSSP